jgi:hypothetical protein
LRRDEMGLYERIMNGEKLRVKLRKPMKGCRFMPFTVQRLLLIGPAHYVHEGSEWARYAKVGGILLNGRIKESMEEQEMQEWLEGVIEV